MNLTEIKPEKQYSINGRHDLTNALLYAYELARKNSQKGNMTSSSYACGIVLEDNSVYFGVNFNSTRNDISSICAERLAILNAFNTKVKQFSPGQKFDYKIKYILIANYLKEGVFWSEKITPCADCLSWFNTSSNFSSDTKIVSLKKDKNGEIFLDYQDLSSFLPLRNLHFEIPKEGLKIKDKNLQKLYDLVFKAYINNSAAKTSGQNIAAGVLANGKIFTGIKIDYSKRWFTEPLEIAAAKAIEEFKNDTKINALCYIGEEYTTTETGQKVKDGLISIKTLGRLSTKYINPDTTVLSVSNGKIETRKVRDFLPVEHTFIQNYKIN